MKNIFHKFNKSINKILKMNTLNIESLDSTKTPKAIGPYSKATKVNLGQANIIFCSGSLGLDPYSGNLVSEDVGEQTRQALENMKNLLE
jgi:2-iminobutanoate/2-iminopropanoate deaminase